MTALPVSASESAVRGAVDRLSALEPGANQVVSCYLKLEPRDKARAKYVIKIKNRIKQVASDLERRPLDHAQRESVRADLDRLRRYFEGPSGSFRSTRSAPSRDSWPRASAWTQRRCCRTSIPTSTTSCSASCA